MKLPLIAELRKQNKLTQQTIADALSATKRAYAAWERGENDLPLDMLVRLADYYNVSTDYLLGRVPMDVQIKKEAPPAVTEGEEEVVFTVPDGDETAFDEAFDGAVRQIVRQELTRRGI